MRNDSPRILQYPDPILRQVCTPVDSFDGYLVWIVNTMRRAIDESRVKLLGLAANQIGETKRVIVVVQGGQQIAMVNPVIVLATGIQTIRDGCASVKFGTDFRARTRPRFVTVEYRDVHGTPQRRRANGMHAAAIAHEVEHLDGKMFFDVLEGAA